MTTTTMADLQQMGLDLRKTLEHVLLSALANQHPDLKAQCQSIMLTDGLGPLRPSLDSTLVSPPGNGTETILKEVARQVCDRTGARIDFFSTDPSSFHPGIGMGLGNAWNIERFGTDNGKGLHVGILNDLNDEAAQTMRDQYPEALLIRRYYRLDAELANKLANQERAAPEVPETLGQMHPEMRRACQVIGYEIKTKQSDPHPFTLISEHDPERAGLYVANRAAALPAPPAQVSGGANDEEALRQASLTHGSMAGKMLAKQLLRGNPEVAHVLQGFGDASPAMVSEGLARALPTDQQEALKNASPEETAIFLTHEAYHWCAKQRRAMR